MIWKSLFTLHNSPDSIVLLVVRPTAVPRKPRQSYGELAGVTRHVVRSMRLSALHHQLRSGDDGGHLVTSHALVETEVRSPE